MPGFADVSGPVGGSRPRCVDTTKPNIARIYDYLLGGKDHFEADRVAAQKLISVLPDAPFLARANRVFLSTAVKHVARQGVRQFIDIGSGLPTAANVHQSARSVLADAKVAYVDNDPVVLAHARALLASDNGVIVIDGDARRPDTILENPALSALIDRAEPVCVLFVSMLHFFLPAEADALVARFREWMNPGSYLVISAGHGQGREPDEEIKAAYGGATILTGRPAAEIAAYFDGFELLPPGLVPLTQWRLEEPGNVQPPPRLHITGIRPNARMLAGVGRKEGTAAGGKGR